MNISSSTTWWQTFFQGHFQELQLGGINNDKTPTEVDHLITTLKLLPHHRILDAPCGPGRHSLELSRRGYTVTGIDFNPPVIDRARSLAQEEGLSPEFQLGDLRSLEFDAEFDRVLCLWGSFGYFSDEENAAHLRGVYRALVPGGAFYLDAFLTESLYPTFRARDWAWWGNEGERYRVIEDRAFDLGTSRVNVTWTFQCEQSDNPAPHTPPRSASTVTVSFWHSCEKLDFEPFPRMMAFPRNPLCSAPSGLSWSLGRGNESVLWLPDEFKLGPHA